MWILLKSKLECYQKPENQTFYVRKNPCDFRGFKVTLQFLYYKQLLLHINFTVVC